MEQFVKRRIVYRGQIWEMEGELGSGESREMESHSMINVCNR